MTRLTLLFAICSLGSLGSLAGAAEKPNVLLIAIDDMNDWVGCLGGHPDARTPNIDRLAKHGVLFTNAHCQAPICNPSRTSIMYGLRPSTSGVYMNSPKPWAVPALRDRVTLPRHFAANGYRTLTTGKIYHGSGLPPGDFDVVGPRPGQRLKIDARLVPATPGGAKGLWDFGPQAYDEALFQDYADATWAIDFLKSGGAQSEEAKSGAAGGRRQATTGNRAKPFFLAIGFYRPHVPFYSPTRIFQQVPADDVDLPPVKEDDRDDLPAVVSDLTRAPAAPPHQWFVESGKWKLAVQSYLACIRWTDEQVGRLLDALDGGPHAGSTIVVLYSDHGFHLGEKQRWAKQALWERATHVPLIISAPGMSQGRPCSRPAELLSIYPTLIDLCGLEKRSDLDGASLVPLLEDPSAEWDRPALTTHGKDNHAVRTERFRYIRYFDGSEELYDRREDPHEWTNLAGRQEHAGLKKRLTAAMPARNAAPARGTIPPGKKRKKASAKKAG